MVMEPSWPSLRWGRGGCGRGVGSRSRGAWWGRREDFEAVVEGDAGGEGAGAEAGGGVVELD